MGLLLARRDPTGVPFHGFTAWGGPRELRWLERLPLRDSPWVLEREWLAAELRWALVLVRLCDEEGEADPARAELALRWFVGLGDVHAGVSMLAKYSRTDGDAAVLLLISATGLLP